MFREKLRYTGDYSVKKGQAAIVGMISAFSSRGKKSEWFILTIGKRRLFLQCRFLIVMYQPALVDALPVFREELPVSTGFHRGVVLLPADNAFHQA